MGTGVDPKWHAYNVSAYCYHKKLAHRHLEHINDLFVFGAGAIRSSIHCWVHRGPSAFSHWHLGLRSVRDDNAGTGYFLFYKFYWTIEHQTNEILNCHHLSGEAHSTQEWSIVAGGKTLFIKVYSIFLSKPIFYFWVSLYYFKLLNPYLNCTFKLCFY